MVSIYLAQIFVNQIFGRARVPIPQQKNVGWAREHWQEMGIGNWAEKRSEAEGWGCIGHWYQLFVIASPKRVTNNK